MSINDKREMIDLLIASGHAGQDAGTRDYAQCGALEGANGEALIAQGYQLRSLGDPLWVDMVIEGKRLRGAPATNIHVDILN